MSETRSRKTLSSLLFKLVESLGNQGLAFVVSLLLARALAPSDYGVLSMLLVFIAIAQVFVQSGLNTALIQKKDVDETDLSSVFFVSFGMAAVFYAILFVLSPWLADFFRMPALKSTLRVMALILLPGSLISVQTAVVSRQMAFRKQMVASLCATVLSGTVGVVMARNGAGYWALVAQQMTNQCALAILLLVLVKWRPHFMFSFARVREHFCFGWKLLVSGLLDTVFTNLRSMVIGRKFSDEALAFFTRGKQFPELAMNAINGSISSVMLPVLSEQQDETQRMKQTMRRSVMLSCFVVVPLLAGLAAVAEPLIKLLLTDKWLPCVPFLQLCCIDFALYPIHTSNLSAINAKGRSDVFLRLEIIKKAYGMVILLVSVLCFDSVMAIAWGGVISSVVSAAVNAHPNKELINYGYLEQMRDILPTIVLSLIMFGVVYAMNLLALPTAVLLVLQIIVGVIVYGGLSLLFKLESVQFLYQLLGRLRKRG
ncbi:MAG: oligosaccharide flippase family protein [Clostridia bacterium]|nr:oligosaccharide flippase family protein [Clostridia bacterium]